MVGLLAIMGRLRSLTLIFHSKFDSSWNSPETDWRWGEKIIGWEMCFHTTLPNGVPYFLSQNRKLFKSINTFFLKYIFNTCFIYIQLINFHILNSEDNRKLYLQGLILTWFTPEWRKRTKPKKKITIINAMLAKKKWNKILVLSKIKAKQVCDVATESVLL